MAMGTERSKALHNFPMSCSLKWGNQRFLRCIKVNSEGRISPRRRCNTDSSGSSDHHHPIQQRRTTRDRDRDRERAKDSSFEFGCGSTKVGPAQPPAAHGSRRFSDDDDDGIAAMRQKMIFDLQTAADKMKDAIFKDGLEEHEASISPPVRPPPPPPPPPPAAASSEGDTNCRWNLRTRRAASKMTGTGSVAGGGNGRAGGKGLTVDAPLRPNSEFSQMRPGAGAAAAGASHKSPIHRSDGDGAAANCQKKERAKFSVSLSKSDIEEDFYTMVGHRPPRRPKKRARIVQKQLDTVFPGLWLTEVTPDMYKVVEAAP